MFAGLNTRAVINWASIKTRGVLLNNTIRVISHKSESGLEKKMEEIIKKYIF